MVKSANTLRSNRSPQGYRFESCQGYQTKELTLNIERAIVIAILVVLLMFVVDKVI